MLALRNWLGVRACLVAGAIAFVAPAATTFAVSLNWDPTLSGSSFYGGSGTWDVSTTANWFNGTTDVQWTDTTGAVDTAIFGGNQGGTVTISSNPLGALGMQFPTPGYTIAGTQLTLGASGIQAISVPPGITTISAPISLTGAQTWTINGGSTLVASNSLTGSTTLTKASTGTLVLSGNNSGFSGNITLNNGGQLSVGNANALGAGTITFGNNAVVIANTSGGVLTNAGNNPITLNASPTFIGGAGFNLGTGTVTFGANRTPVIRGNVTWGPISSTNSLTKSGDGTLNIDNAANSYTATSVVGGTLNLGTTGVMGGDTQTLTLGNGELRMAGGNAAPRAQSTSTYTPNSGRNTLTLVADPLQNISLTSSSIGARGVYATGLYRGNSLGTTTIASATAGVANIAYTTAPTSSTVIAAGTTYGATGSGTSGTTEAAVFRGVLYDGSATGNGTAFATYDAANGVRALNSATEQNTTYPGAASNDNVRLNLAGATPITGVLTNTLQLDNTSGTPQTVTNTGTALSAANGLLFSGTSPITLTGGTYNFNNVGAVGTTVADGVILSTNSAGVTIDSSLAFVNGTGERGWTIGGPGDVTINGALGGAGGNGAVAINGPGTVTLNSATTTSSKGILVQGGTVKLGTNFSMSTSRPWQVAAGATLDMNGKSVANVEAASDSNLPGNVLGGVITNSSATATTLTFTKGSNQGTGRTSPANISGNMSVVYNHQAPTTPPGGNTTLTGQSTYTGTTALMSGIFTNGIHNTFPIGTALTADGGGAVPVVYNLNAFNQQVGSLAGNATGGGAIIRNVADGTTSILTINGGSNTTYSGVLAADNDTALTGALAVVKAGSGIQTFTGDNTYTGGTFINGGTLLVNNTTGSGTGTGPVTVNSGTLGGSGTINTSTTNANVVITTGSSLAPGASAGTLTFDLGTGALNLAGVNSGGFKFELNTPATSDKVVVSNASTSLNLGTLDFSDFTFTNLGGVTANTDYVLFDALSAFTATLGTANGTFGGFNAMLQLDNATNFDVLLKVGAAAGNAGDFDLNGKVDAADYVFWRKNYGDDPRYIQWRSNFGNIYFGSSTGEAVAASSSGTIPEPATCVSLVVLSALVAIGRRRRG